jgi:hypothetical protein
MSAGEFMPTIFLVRLHPDDGSNHFFIATKSVKHPNQACRLGKARDAQEGKTLRLARAQGVLWAQPSRCSTPHYPREAFRGP